MKTLEATTWERLKLLAVVGSLQGNVATIRLAFKMMDKIVLSDEERKEVEWIELPEGNVQWKDSQRLWKLEFDDGEWGLVVQAARNFQGWTPSQLDLNFLNKIIPE